MDKLYTVIKVGVKNVRDDKGQVQSIIKGYGAGNKEMFVTTDREEALKFMSARIGPTEKWALMVSEGIYTLEKNLIPI